MLLGEARELCARALNLVKQAAKTTQNASLLKEAGGLYLKASQLNPNSADPYLGLALILFSAGHHNQALGLLEKALELEPTNRKAGQLKRRYLKTLEKKNKVKPQPTFKIAAKSHRLPLDLIRDLRREITTPRLLVQLVDLVFGKKLEKEAIIELLELIQQDASESQLSPKQARLLEILSQIHADMNPETFVEEIKATLKSFHRLRFLTQLKAGFKDPGTIIQSVRVIFDYALPASQAEQLFHLAQTGTMDGKVQPTLQDKLNIATLMSKIIGDGQPFGEQMQKFVTESMGYFK